MSKHELDDFGNRMKAYEAVESQRLILQGAPVYIRLDGRSFSRFTSGLPRPYDPNVSWAMKKTTEELVRQFKADIAYTQSDEISLGWKNESDFIFSGRIQKINSVLAGVASAAFMKACYRLGGVYEEKAYNMLPSFDSRLFQTPDLMEMINAFIWRAQDCRKNATSMAARAHFSHKALQGKGQKEMKEMMQTKGIDFNTYYPSFFRNGTYLKRVVREMPMPLSVPDRFRTDEPVLRTRIIRTVLPTWSIFGGDHLMKFWFPEEGEKEAADV